jgi:peptidyl-prolyl cis-trans isomerase C
MPLKQTNIIVIVILLSLAGWVSGCSPAAKSTPTAPAARKTAAGPTQSAAPQITLAPTPTEGPLAAKVNGEGIPLAVFEASLKNYQAAQVELGQKATPDPTQQQKAVLDDLVDQVLLAQAATQAGHAVDDAAVQARLAQLSSEAGSDQALADWQNKNGYTAESFKAALKIQMTAAWQRDQIISAVPTTADQVHARQILVFSASLADTIEQKLVSGSDFATLALQYDPQTGGDLGWFPKGYLTQPEVEAAAFSLEPGKFSQVIHSKIGYHILLVIERDAKHTLSPDALQLFQHQALQKWLDDQRSKAQIVVVAP